MSPDVAATIIQHLIQVIRHDLEEAAGVALAAEACAERGAVGKAVEIANEVDDPAYDAGRLHGVITLIKRKYLPTGEAANIGNEGDESDA